MYLTAGQYKGRKIIVPDGVKPTLSKVRQGVFNMLNQYDFKNNTFLDMFSGSGLMSLEAISRGYNSFCLEINPKNAAIIKRNYSSLNLKADITVVNALKYKTDKKFDIVYLDPPWDADYLPAILKAKSVLNEDGIIVAEYDELNKINLEELLLGQNVDIIKSKKYGRALISLLK